MINGRLIAKSNLSINFVHPNNKRPYHEKAVLLIQLDCLKNPETY